MRIWFKFVVIIVYLSSIDWLSTSCFHSVLFFFHKFNFDVSNRVVLEPLCFISEIWSEQGQFDTEHLACWQQTTTRYVIIKRVLFPLSCSMTSGKSGLWCDANLSCLRISTPQKPWSPTAELKTCWPPMMDSRSRHLPALWSNCPFNPRQPWTSSLPRCRSYTGDPCWALHPSSYYEFTQNPQFSFIPAAQVQNPVSTSLRFLLSQVLFFIWRGAGVCLCVFKPLATFSLFPPPPSVPLTFLSPSTPLCAHCKCGTSEYGHRNAGSFIPSCKRVHNGLNIGTDWLTVTCLFVSAWFSFLSKGTKSEPVGQMKKTRLSRHLLFVCFLFFFFCSILTDILSVPTPLCSLCLFHVCICDF